MSSTVYLVIHQKLPTYDMYLNPAQYSEPIQTVNAQVVGVYSTSAMAEKAMQFFGTLGLADNGGSENGGYNCSALPRDS
jgi:hypothetical protein